MEDWKNFLIQMCEESDQMAQAVRKKGKSLEKCMAQILKVSFETKAQLDDRIVRAAGKTTYLFLEFLGKHRLEKLQKNIIRVKKNENIQRIHGRSESNLRERNLPIRAWKNIQGREK